MHDLLSVAKFQKVREQRFKEINDLQEVRKVSVSLTPQLSVTRKLSKADIVSPNKPTQRKSMMGAVAAKD